MLPTDCRTVSPSAHLGRVGARLQIWPVRLLFATLAFCLCLLGLTSSAQAAPSGMCSEDAESIQAPLPMFPADDAILVGCDDERDFEFLARGALSHNDRLSPLKKFSEVEGTLGESSFVDVSPSRSKVEVVSDRWSGAEHRWQGRKPPRA